MKKSWFCSKCGAVIHTDYGWVNKWKWYALKCEACGKRVVPVREGKDEQ